VQGGIPLSHSKQTLNFGGGAWTRTTDLRIMSSEPPVADKEDKGLSSAESGKVPQNPQPPRNKEQPATPTDPPKGGTR
jgi:hypothetical protein